MRLITYIAVIMAAMLVAGCATTQRRHSSTEEAPRALNVAMALKFEDVPIPSGFRAVANESFTFQNDVLRVGILRYTGGASAEHVVDFYKDQMPLYNWRFQNILEYDRRIMSFDREDQTCIIVIEPSNFNTSVTLTVAPKGGRAATYKTVKEERERGL